MKTPEEIRYRLEEINKEIVELKNQKRYGRLTDFSEIEECSLEDIEGLMREESALRWALK